MNSPYYTYHVFVCTNKREQYSACDDYDTQSVRDYMKAEMKKRNCYGEGKVRIGQSGCLGRCLSGPVMVVYPEGTWYTFFDREDIDEIIESHLINHHIVDRLLIDESPTQANVEPPTLRSTK
jgi:(2Fe-2S) ferredoxin